jgi:hypothetical protein
MMGLEPLADNRACSVVALSRPTVLPICYPGFAAVRITRLALLFHSGRLFLDRHRHAAYCLTSQ